MLMVLLFQKHSNRLRVSPDSNQLVPLEQKGNSIKELRVTGTHLPGPAALDSSEVEAYGGSSSRKVGWVPHADWLWQSRHLRTLRQAAARPHLCDRNRGNSWIWRWERTRQTHSLRTWPRCHTSMAGNHHKDAMENWWDGEHKTPLSPKKTTLKLTLALQKAS